MRDKFRGRFFWTMIFIMVFLFGFGLSMVSGGGTTPPQQLIGIIATPFQTAGAWIKNSFSGLFETFSNYDALEAENKELKAKIADLEKSVENSYTLELDNERLHGLLNIKETYPNMELIEATVVSVSSGGWQSTFSINKGTVHGIGKKDVVISSQGLVGYVKEVGLNWAKIVTILDPQAAVGAHIIRTGDVAMTEGTIDLKSEGLCRLTYIKNTVLINRGDIVETSGLGGLYPAGIRIGKISSIEVEDSGLSQYAIITPAVDFSSLQKVYIVSNFEIDEEK